MKRVFVYLAAALMISSCSESEEIVLEENKLEADAPAGVFFNEETQEWQAEQDDYEFEWLTEELSDNAGRIGGNIIDEVDEFKGSGGLEVNYNLPFAGSVITGIGLRAVDKKITTMHLERRYVNSDGTLGTRYRSEHGSSSDLEVWAAVPDNHVIVGIGGRIRRGNVTTLHVHYMQLSSNKRLVGQVKTIKVGSAPNNALEMECIVGYEGAFDFSRSVITGMGFRENNDNFAAMRFRIGELK